MVIGWDGWYHLNIYRAKGEKTDHKVLFIHEATTDTFNIKFSVTSAIILLVSYLFLNVHLFNHNSR